VMLRPAPRGVDDAHDHPHGRDDSHPPLHVGRAPGGSPLEASWRQTDSSAASSTTPIARPTCICPHPNRRDPPLPFTRNEGVPGSSPGVGSRDSGCRACWGYQMGHQWGVLSCRQQGLKHLGTVSVTKLTPEADKYDGQCSKPPSATERPHKTVSASPSHKNAPAKCRCSRGQQSATRPQT
jgi:hypothetical protein